MSDINEHGTALSRTVEAGSLGPAPADHPSGPVTGQMRTVGDRRRDAEAKLSQHLQEAQAHRPVTNGQ
jgi:hypothetical protein